MGSLNNVACLFPDFPYLFIAYAIRELVGKRVVVAELVICWLQIQAFMRTKSFYTDSAQGFSWQAKLLVLNTHVRTRGRHMEQGDRYGFVMMFCSIENSSNTLSLEFRHKKTFLYQKRRLFLSSLMRESRCSLPRSKIDPSFLLHTLYISSRALSPL